MSKLPFLLLLMVPLCALPQGSKPGDDKPDKGAEAASPTIQAKTASMKHMDGLLPIDWDTRSGKLYLEIPRLGPDGRSEELLYDNSLPYGTGSNDLGLDRGQISEGRIVRFERSGPRCCWWSRIWRFARGVPTPTSNLP